MRVSVLIGTAAVLCCSQLASAQECKASYSTMQVNGATIDTLEIPMTCGEFAGKVTKEDNGEVIWFEGNEKAEDANGNAGNRHRGCNAQGTSYDDCARANFYFHCDAVISVHIDVLTRLDNGNDDSAWLMLDSNPPLLFSRPGTSDSTFDWRTVGTMLVGDDREHRVQFREREDGIRFKTLRLWAEVGADSKIQSCKVGRPPQSTTSTVTTTTNTIDRVLDDRLKELEGETHGADIRNLSTIIEGQQDEITSLKNMVTDLTELVDTLSTDFGTLKTNTLVSITALESATEGLQGQLKKVMDAFVPVGNANPAENVVGSATCSSATCEPEIAQTDDVLSIKSAQVKVQATCGDIDVCALATSLQNVLSAMDSLDEIN